jgi:hypothetical protein
MMVTSRPGMLGQNPGMVSTGMAETSRRWRVVLARAAAQPVANSQMST